MYKSIIIAAALVGSFATASAQVSNIDNHGVATINGQTETGHFTTRTVDLATQADLNLVRDGQQANYERIIALENAPAAQNGRDGVDGQDGARGLRGFLGHQGERGATGETGAAGRDGSNGRDGIDGVDGQNGRDGTDGVNGRDGRDAFINIKDLHKGIAGSTALGFANAGGDGIGVGIGAFNDTAAIGFSVTKSDGNHQVSAGFTSAKQFGVGYKFKF